MSEQETKVSGVKRIENNTGRMIILPSIDEIDGEEGYPRGINLPAQSLTTVPNRYLDALAKLEVPNGVPVGTKWTEQAQKKAGTRFPGRVIMKQLLDTVRIVTADGVTFGPQITVYEPEQVEGRKDGPKLPYELDSYKDAIALKLIENIQDRDALIRWSRDRRPAVAQAAAAKASTLPSN